MKRLTPCFIKFCLHLGLKALARWPIPEISKVNFALTMKCNHKCVTCEIWKGNKESTDELSAGVVGAVLQNNPRIMWASITGGEPTLANDFEEIVLHCVRHCQLTNIITNGQLPDRLYEPVKYILKNTPQSHLLIVHITLFGDERIHDEMTGIAGSYAKAIKSMALLKSLGYKNRLVLGFEHLICHYNPKQYAHVQHVANSMGVGITYTLEQQAGYYRNQNSKIPLKIPGISLTLNPIDQFKNTFLLNAKLKAGCVAGEYSCWVMPDKTVYPCLFSIPDQPCFNLETTGYKLRKRYFDSKRKWIRNCQKKGCWTPCESYTMLAFRPWRIVNKREKVNARLR
jgi:MoaA/NifB/PqqE/SkfB family radical SAM enzyme